MAEEIKELIEKIQQEGIRAAEDKAKEIENEAKRHAEEIIRKAKKESEKIISEAKEEVSRMEASSKELLKHAGRDALLNVKKEVGAMLDKLIVSRVRESLTPEELARIITTLIKNYSAKENNDIVITLKKEDLDKLEKGFLSELKDEIKKGITLKSSDDIRGGFVISYDGGKSEFDFTDKSLTEYLGLYLKPKLREILNNLTPKDTTNK